MKKFLSVLLISAVLCAALCFNVCAENGYAETIYFENFESANDEDLSTMFKISGNDTNASFSLTDDPKNINGKVLAVANKIYSGTGSLWTQLTFADNDVLSRLAAPNKKILAMDFDVMFNEQTAEISRYFFSYAPNSNKYYFYGMNKNRDSVNNNYGIWSSRIEEVRTGIEENKWYNACVSYMFDNAAGKVQIKTVIKEKDASGARSVKGWTNIQDFTFENNNITEFALLYNLITRGVGTAGNFPKVYLDNIKLFTAETENEINIVAARFINDTGAEIKHLTNGGKVKINLSGIELGNNAHKVMPVMVLKNKDTGELIDIKWRLYGNSTWRSASEYGAGYFETYIEIPEMGNYEATGYVWQAGPENEMILKPLCLPFSISTEEAHHP